MICVECGRQGASQGGSKAQCIHCNERMDKYAQASEAYGYIDCLLLKEEAFRHYLLNVPVTPLRYLKIVLFQLMSMAAIQIPGTPKLSCVQDLLGWKVQVFITLLHVLVLAMIFRSAGWQKISFAVLFSSFFSYFRIILVLWECDPHYNVILELLNCCANITALKCFDDRHLRVLQAVFISRTVCWLAIGSCI